METKKRINIEEIFCEAVVLGFDPIIPDPRRIAEYTRRAIGEVYSESSPVEMNSKRIIKGLRNILGSEDRDTESALEFWFSIYPGFWRKPHHTNRTTTWIYYLFEEERQKMKEDVKAYFSQSELGEFERLYPIMRRECKEELGI